jgi:hypothetical protein
MNHTLIGRLLKANPTPTSLVVSAGFPWQKKLYFCSLMIPASLRWVLVRQQTIMSNVNAQSAEFIVD